MFSPKAKNVNAGMAGWKKLEPIAVLYIQKHVLSSKLEVYVFLKYQHCRVTVNAKIKNSTNRKRFQNKCYLVKVICHVAR